MVSTEVNTDQNTINVDWERFGLGDNAQRNNATERSRSQGTSQRTYDTEYQFGPGGHQASDANELFAEEQGDKPWWKSNFFISEPVLFGQWDGVFTSCLINIFGVIVFLRSGWIVAQAGVLNAVLIVLATVTVALVSVLSAVGICERCRMESGGVYFLVAYVLGSQYGGALGLLYVFGQAVGCALNVLGFGESIAGLFGLTDTPWATRGFASAAVLLLGVINVAGVKWVVKLQFLLLIILLLAGLDFAVGSFVHTDAANGFTGWMTGRLTENTFPDYHDGYSWFTVFGVFFPTVTGVMAGINMSGDLRYPSRDIPNGTLAAMGTGTLLYLIFVLFLGSTCLRNVLLTDFMIASKVSIVSVLLLAGLYVSSMSSCLGAMYGTPRVLQSIANENVIPVIQILGRGRGPNKVPLYSLTVVAVVTLTFILVGQINTLAPVVTMPFLITYASIDYAYFALAQTHDIHQRREDRFRAQEFITGSSDGVRHYGGTAERSEDQFSSGDLDTLFPERLQHRKQMILQRSSSVVSSPEEQTNSQAGTHQSSLQNAHIHSKLKNWYSPFCNRWLSLGGLVFSDIITINVAIKILIMFLVHWGYALANIIAVFLVWFYIGHANPAVKPGISSEFKFFRWLKNVFFRCIGRRVQEYEQIIVTPVHPGMETRSSQINEDNEDFSNRRRYHQTSTVEGRFVEIDDD